jgi:hypothetical protein
MKIKLLPIVEKLIYKEHDLIEGKSKDSHFVQKHDANHLLTKSTILFLQVIKTLT